MQKVFENGSEGDSREILISVSKDYIEFFFYEQHKRQLKWIKEESERRMDNGEEELSEEESQSYNFYWMGTEEWIKDKTERLDREDNWHRHMAEKRWFTPQMADFMNTATASL